MPEAVIHETPIALADADFGPDTYVWVTDQEKLVLASGTDDNKVAALGKAASQQHGYQFHETAFEASPAAKRDLSDSPQELED